ncbi:MAG: trypsin-like peptidase domain-containing protein [Pseudomonadota bacterium]
MDWTGPQLGSTIAVCIRHLHEAENHMVKDESPPMKGTAPTADKDVRACLENLTGPSRGRILWLSSDTARVNVDAGGILQVGPDTGVPHGPTSRAGLTWSGETYALEALPGHDIWVNGRKISAAHLIHGDMIEFGDDGPMSRFRLCGHGFPTHWPVEEILSDALAYARTSRRPFGTRVSNAFFEGLRRILLETSLVFRVTVIAVLVLLTTLVALQFQRDQRIERSIEAEAKRLETIAHALAETRQTALTAAELATLREQLDLQLQTNADRLAILEQRWGASARVISQSTASVAFLQGAYGLRHVDSGKLLRHVLGADGAPLITPWGKPVADVDGTGEPLEFQFTGTGFLLRGSGHLVTNKHVALPWTSDNQLQAFEANGFSPEMLKLFAYLPGLSEPAEAQFLSASASADLALLSVAATVAVGRGLDLSNAAPQLGDEVIVMGFPTGLRALLAQAGREFLVELEETGETNFWTIAARLSEQDRIAPLASRGIVAQITPKAVIYDAETTIGGSGGPALDRHGNVIAINAAILPEFGGANIGVPVDEVRRLLNTTTGE